MSVDDLIFPFSFALIPTATVTPLAFLLPHWFPSLAPPLNLSRPLASYSKGK